MKTLKNQSFDKIIKKLRIEAGLSITALAKKVGVSPMCACYWENGKRKPNYEQLRRLCEVLGVSGDLLLCLEDI